MNGADAEGGKDAEAERAPGLVARVERAARIALPFVVSLGLLAWILDRIDIRLALDHVTADVLLRFVPAILIFSAVTLAIEAHCLHRVVAARPEDAAPLRRSAAARIKAACYLIGVLNHLIGAGGLALLVRRRTGASIAVATGIVLLIALLDAGVVLASIVLGGSWLRVDSVGVQLGLVGALVTTGVAGFVFLRAPADLGPLEPVRSLPLFNAARLVPLPTLVELGLLRIGIFVCFASLVAGLFAAFDVPIGALRLFFGVGVMLAIAALPFAVASIGTGQVAFVTVFSGLARDAELLAMSLVLTTSIIVARSLLGLVFAAEFTRDTGRGDPADVARGDDRETPGRSLG
ncbi:MAG: hypothetical protein AAGC67_12025 [Myxococcota bacterium]